MVFSGNLGALTLGIWNRPEAEIFADVAAAAGVPRARMLIEARSTNTGENVDFSRELLSKHGIHPRRAIAVQKPYMERRTLATFQQRWPELGVIVTSPQMDFDAYPNEAIRRDDVIHIMVGDLQRLMLYATRDGRWLRKSRVTSWMHSNGSSRPVTREGWCVTEAPALRGDAGAARWRTGSAGRPRFRAPSARRGCRRDRRG